MIPSEKHALLQKTIINADMRADVERWNGTPIVGQQFSATGDGLTGKWTTYDAEEWLRRHVKIS